MATSLRPPQPGTDAVLPGQASHVWHEFKRFCAEFGHGEIEKLKIQDGVPVMAEIVREKVKFR